MTSLQTFPTTAFVDVPLPKLTISARARKENREAARDAELLMQAAVVVQRNFVRLIRRPLLEWARQQMQGFHSLPVLPEARISANLRRIAEILAAADIAGRLRTRRQAEAQADDLDIVDLLPTFAEVFGPGVPPGDAVRFIRALPLVKPSEWQAFVIAHQRAAFTLAADQQGKLLVPLRRLIADSLEQGRTFPQFRSLAEELLSEFEVGPRHLRTLWNNTVHNAMRQGRYAELRKPEISRVLSHWLFDAFIDGRVRPNHRVLDGGIAPVTWSGWRTYGDPLGHNCRCARSAITGGRAQRMIQGGEGFDLTRQIPRGAGPDPNFTKVN